MNGYILESKSILDSDIWKKPPIYFKVWHYLLIKAEYAGYGNLKRGQLFTSIQEIREACSYYKGFQKVIPTKREIWAVIDWLRRSHEGNDEGNGKGTMIVTTKVTHGMLVTICNYNKYQNPRTYEGNNDGNNEGHMKVTTCGQDGNNIINENNKKNKRKDLEREVEREEPFMSQHDMFAPIKAMLAAGAQEVQHE